MERRGKRGRDGPKARARLTRERASVTGGAAARESEIDESERAREGKRAKGRRRRPEGGGCRTPGRGYLNGWAPKKARGEEAWKPTTAYRVLFMQRPV